MTPTLVFLTDAGLIVFACAGIVAYVSRNLRLLLIELCGTAGRAGFWMSFCKVALVLVPLIFSLHFNPDWETGKNIVFEMAAQLKYGLIGFVATFSLLSVILLSFIPKDRPPMGANEQR
ncbi:MAG TPA: hypothetical protein VGS20_06845 [Candidatus Acidoferrales bacterium]|nr:hypothetical protein [Candidatus Acidoferrales bacterium]